MILSGAGIAVAVISLGFLIFIHELGHFLAAKRSGITVERFSLGFGPKLIQHTWRGTEYRLSLLPFGGYVKMLGENPAEERVDVPGAFHTAPISRRIFVAVAGPAMNVLLGVVAFTILYTMGIHIPKSAQTTAIGYVQPGGPAAVAGIRPGDMLVSVNGMRVKNWEDVTTMIFTQPVGKEAKIVLVRNGEEITLPVKTVAKEAKFGEGSKIGILPRVEVIVGDIVEDSPAAQMGINPKDTIVAINGKPVRSYDDVFSEAAQNFGKEVTLTLKRYDKDVQEQDEKAGQFFTVNLPAFVELRVSSIEPDSVAAIAPIPVKPLDIVLSVNGKRVSRVEDIKVEAQNNPGKEIAVGFKRGEEIFTVNIIPELNESDELVDMGGLSLRPSTCGMFLTEPIEPQKYNHIFALGRGIQESWFTIGKIFFVIKGLFSGTMSFKHISGPVGIVQITTAVAMTSFRGFLFLLGFISVNLAIINLLPIPVADGGLILFFTFEKLRGKPLSLKKQIVIQQVGIWLLIFLFILVTWNDVLRIVRHQFS